MINVYIDTAEYWEALFKLRNGAVKLVKLSLR